MTTQAKPKFITFTGADDYTPIAGMIELSMLYPIEWGILFSPKRQGEGRYPPMEAVNRFRDVANSGGLLTLSAHICGGHSRELIESGVLPALEGVIDGVFSRIQINTADPKVDPYWIGQWADRLGCRAIIQTRGAFPNDERVDWLFDASGGRGIVPATWPDSRGVVLRGYAGGLNPNNVADAVGRIGEMVEHYWIDMESGVRDANDRFDLSLCRQVCEAIYG